MNIMSEQVNELFIALSKAQGEFRLVEKSANNPFFKSKYADLGSFIKESREVLCKNGLCVTQTTVHENGILFLTTFLGHVSGQWIKGTIPIQCTKNTPQEMGSAITYARRYAFAAITGMTGGDDDDDANLAQTGIELEEKNLYSEVEEILKKDQEFSDQVQPWLKSQGFDKIAQIPLSVIKTVLSRYNSRKENGLSNSKKVA